VGPAGQRARDGSSAIHQAQGTKYARPITTFTPFHRGGAGPSLVCLHGFSDTWRTWELVIPALERHHDVLIPSLPGHAGGPPLDGDIVDAVERLLDDAGIGAAHLVGNSLGGYIAFQLAARGRAASVVALAPAGGWARDDDSWRELLAWQSRMLEGALAAAPFAPADGLDAHRVLGAAVAADSAQRLLDRALQEGWQLDAERVRCPVRIVWGTEDELLPWPSAAARYRHDWFPTADWVVLDGVGHYPQIEVPVEASELILGFTRHLP
jgi:pimeloyl-ACP methyl ester carboxylesterase